MIRPRLTRLTGKQTETTLQREVEKRFRLSVDEAILQVLRESATYEEAAARLGVRRRTLDRWRKQFNIDERLRALVS